MSAKVSHNPLFCSFTTFINPDESHLAEGLNGVYRQQTNDQKIKRATVKNAIL